MAKLTAVCPYHKILVGNKNELITDAHNLDGSLGHYAKWTKQILTSHAIWFSHKNS